MRARHMTKDELYNMVGGRFFHVTFLKKDGTIRNMNARLGVKKYLKHTVNHDTYNAHPTVVTVYDMKAKGYRAFDLDRVYNVRQGDKVKFGHRASSLAGLI
jgi:hypothetical protein